MGELTPCNHCGLRSIERRAKAKGLVVTKKPARDSWTNIYVHPEGVTEFPDNNNGEPSEYFAASMMKITDHCVC